MPEDQPPTLNIGQAKQWQNDFTKSLFNGLSEPLATTFSNKGDVQQQQRFAIYQNNVFYSLTQALGDLYPVIKRLVGSEFFDGCASIYIRQNPPQQAAMVYFGHDFPGFLSHFEHTKTMPYLADVATLELARHHAYHADDVVIMEPKDFNGIDDDVFAMSKVSLHPSVHLLSSEFPVFQIWQSNQTDHPSEENIDLNEPESVIIVRHDYERLVFQVDHGTYQFYHALLEKMNISDAASYALENIKVDISSAIALGIQNGFFTGLIQT
ncbi:MAG: HvfC/BufC family peptide modification chaperone [Cellvibrionaceae bacterium]